MKTAKTQNPMFALVLMNLRLFDAAPTVTTDAGMSADMKIFYADLLKDDTKPLLIHDQAGQKVNIPANRGKTIEFRKFSSFPKALTPLTEGVTPNGRKLSMTSFQSEIHQYGDYVPISDTLKLTALDNVIVQATEQLGNQAGVTLDTVTREVLNGGTNVQYGEGRVAARNLLAGGGATNDYLTVKAIKMAVRTLKNQNVKKINGSFFGIIHPDVAFDLTEDPNWRKPKEYCDPEDLYDGEIGKIAGVRFVETTEAKKFISAGAGGRDVYSTLIIGADAYGVTSIDGGGLEHIVKQLGSAGTSDPLNQRATCGWKAYKTAERLNEANMVRVETASTFSDGVAN